MAKKTFTIEATPHTLHPRHTGKAPGSGANERDIVRSGDDIVFQRIEGQVLYVRFESKELFGDTDTLQLDDEHPTATLTVKVNPGVGKVKKYEIHVTDKAGGGGPVAEKGSIVVVGGSGL